MGEFKQNITFEVNIKGRIIMDLMDISKLYWLGTDVGYSLESQSQKFLGEGKIKIGDIDKCYNEDFEKFVEYNVKDVELCVRLDKVNKLIENMQSFQDIISINLDDTPVAGKTIYYYMKQYSSIVLDNSYTKPSERIPGGYVLDVPNGIFDNVLKFDFASHYPSDMRQMNISTDTTVKNPSDMDKPNLIHFSCYYHYDTEGKSFKVILPGENKPANAQFFEVWFRKDVRGIIPIMLDDLTEKRLHYKKIGDSSKSTVYKRLLNSFFGIFSYKNSRFFNLDCGRAITLSCQYITRKHIQRIESKGYGKGILSDTDSIAFNIFNNAKVEDIEKLSKELLEEFKKECNIDKMYSKFELEDKIDRIILYGVKKKYAEKINHIIKDDKDKPKIIGLECIRKDCPSALKEFQLKAIDYILNTEKPNLKSLNEIKNIIKDKIRLAINNKDYLYFAMPTVIKKEIDQYESNTAEKKALKNSGLKISINENFYILPCVGNNDLAFKSVSDLDKHQFQPDYEMICDKIFNNIGIWENLFVKQMTLGGY
jgi:DNA polymerase, archaea type